MPPLLFHQYPCRLKDWEGDQANDRGRGDEEWIAYSPTEQDRETVGGDKCSEPVADCDRAGRHARAEDRADRSDIGPLDEALHIWVGAMAQEDRGDGQDQNKRRQENPDCRY